MEGVEEEGQVAEVLEAVGKREDRVMREGEVRRMTGIKCLWRLLLQVTTQGTRTE